MAKQAKPVAKETKPVAKETKPAPKPVKTEKAPPRKQPNFFERMTKGVQNYFRETVGELRKVSWPTRQEAWSLTVIVLIVTGVMAALLGTFDWLFSKFFEFLLTLNI